MSLDRLSKVFSLCDDGDGRLSLNELLHFAERGRQSLALKDTQVAMEEMDLDSDGVVSFEEIHGGSDLEPIDEEDRKELEQRLLEDRRLFDAAGGAKEALTVSELRSLLYPETDKVVLRLVAESALKRKDLDKDGELSLQEFWEGDVTAGGPDGHQEEEATFKLLDKDGSGRLSVVELMDWESGVHHTQVAFKELLRMCDDDLDGSIDLGELTAHHQQISNTDAAYHLLEWAEHYEL